MHNDVSKISIGHSEEKYLAEVPYCVSPARLKTPHIGSAQSAESISRNI